MTNPIPQMSELQPDHPEYLRLYVAIESMKEQLIYMRKELETLNLNHEKEIDNIKRENKQLTQDVIELRIKAGQVAALSALFAIIIPIIITLLSPKLHLNESPAAAHESIPSLGRQNELSPAN